MIAALFQCMFLAYEVISFGFVFEHRVCFSLEFKKLVWVAKAWMVFTGILKIIGCSSM